MEMKNNTSAAKQSGLSNDQDAIEILHKYQEALSQSRYSPEKLEKKRKEVTLMSDRVFEAVFSGNKNNELLALIVNALRMIHGLPPILRVVNSQVQKSSLHEVLMGRRMIADLVGEAEKSLQEKLNLAVEVQAELEEYFSTRGTLSSSNVMRSDLNQGVPYALAPDVIGINILGFKLPDLLYSDEFCTRIVRTNYDAPENFFLAEKYSDYYLELPKLKKKEQFAEKYHELWEICKVFKENTEKQEEDIRMGVITSPVAQRLSNEFRKATNDPQLMENLLTDEEFRRLLIERDNNIHDFALSEGRAEGLNKGRVEGKIELYFTEMNFSAGQIAGKLSMDEGSVIAVLKRIGLV